MGTVGCSWSGKTHEGVTRPARRLMSALAFIFALACAIAPSALALSPSVGTSNASNVGETTATLNGSVNPNGLETKTYFEYGPTAAYGSKTAEVNVGSGTSSIELAKAVTSLTANTTYHYRIVATNSSGASQGADRTFTVGWKVQGTTGSTMFKDVSCTSADACTAVGPGGASRWNGSEWKSQTIAIPAGGTEVTLNGVSCVSATACTAVGLYRNSSAKWVTLVEVWNGSEWKVQLSPNPASTGAELGGVSCTSSTECTAVGNYWSSGPPETQQSLAMRWNGTEWKIQTTPNPNPNSAYLKSVSCSSSTFCLAVGFYYDSVNAKWVPLSEQWNGTEWTLKTAVQPAGSTMSWLYSVSCTSSTACTAVGDKEINAGTHQHETMAQRWNGSAWALQTTPNPAATNLEFLDVSCVSATACTGVGSFWPAAGGGATPMALRWDGSTWTVQTLPSPAGSTKSFAFGVSCVLSRGCQAVGHYWNESSAIVSLAESNWRAAAPTTTTAVATSVGEKTATVNGTVNPNGSETKVYFEYGKTTSYGSQTAEVNIGSGTSAVEASIPLTGLSPSTTYHYRIVGNNENPETGKGADKSFTTTGPPTVLAMAAEVDKATAGAVTLKASINPNGFSTTYQFEYGTSSKTYTTTVPIPAESIGNGTEFKTVTYKVTGLTPGTKYYYRATASNEKGESNGAETFFTPVGPPGATTSAASGITRNCATLNGSVAPHGLKTEYQFEYGPTTSYGSKIPVSLKEVSGETETASVEEVVCGLSSKSLYHYRLVAKNTLGTTNGEDQTFTTLSAVSLTAKGVLLEKGVSLKASSSNFSLNGGVGTYSCPETEFAGSVAENPGAVQSASTVKIQNTGGTNCPVPSSSFSAKVTVSEAVSLEYTTDQFGGGVARTSKFTAKIAYYFGAFKTAECEYNLQLNGNYTMKAALAPTLGGKSELVKSITGSCPESEVALGSFAVTSNGNAVEASI